MCVSIMKRVLIVFDSTYGNTERLAKEIGNGIQESGLAWVQVINIKEIDDHDLSPFDGVLFGCPVHAFRATRGIRRAVKIAAKKGLEGKLVAAFDTYQSPNHKGKAVNQIRDMLRKKASGVKFFSHDLTAVVCKHEGPLDAKEPARAREFGQEFAQALGE